MRGESNIPAARGKLSASTWNRPIVGPTRRLWAILQETLSWPRRGSFFTSLMPNLLVPYVREAIRASQAVRIDADVATQPGETDGFGAQLLHAPSAPARPGCIHHSSRQRCLPQPLGGQRWRGVGNPAPRDEALDYRLFTGDSVDSGIPNHHHPDTGPARHGA